MASTLSTITSAIKTAIAAATVAGGYSNDLNGTDQVHIGITSQPPVLPVVYIAECSLTSEHAHALGMYDRKPRFTIYGYVGANSSTPGAEFLAAADLLDDITKAVEADRTLGLSNVYDLIFVDTLAMDGLDIDNQTFGACGVVLEVHYREQTGV